MTDQSMRRRQCYIALKQCCPAGGPQLYNAAYVPPRYRRITVPHTIFKEHLQDWKRHLQVCNPGQAPHITIDVAIPSYRADPQALHALLSSETTEPNVSLRILIQIDQPQIPSSTAKWLSQQQETQMHRLRVRQNSTNIGAGMTRNALLDASAADYVLFFDDDVRPTAGCIDAYVRAARAHPTAVGFAGTQI